MGAINRHSGPGAAEGVDSAFVFIDRPKDSRIGSKDFTKQMCAYTLLHKSERHISPVVCTQIIGVEPTQTFIPSAPGVRQ